MSVAGTASAHDLRVARRWRQDCSIRPHGRGIAQLSGVRALGSRCAPRLQAGARVVSQPPAPMFAAEARHTDDIETIHPFVQRPKLIFHFAGPPMEADEDLGGGFRAPNVIYSRSKRDLMAIEGEPWLANYVLAGAAGSRLFCSGRGYRLVPHNGEIATRADSQLSCVRRHGRARHPYAPNTEIS